MTTARIAHLLMFVSRDFVLQNPTSVHNLPLDHDTERTFCRGGVAVRQVCRHGQNGRGQPDRTVELVMNERHEQIVRYVQERGYASIAMLAADLDVTAQTIRRDLAILHRQGILARQHGGASLSSSLANTRYATRHFENGQEKSRIAATVAAYLPDDASLFMTPGTTVEAVMHALAQTAKTLLIVTNSLEVARIAWQARKFETVLTGGVLQYRNGAMTGRRTCEAIQDYRCDYLISGIGAIEPDGTLYDFHDDEIAVTLAMRQRARRHLVAADQSKFHRVAARRLCAIGDIAALVTDSPPPRTIAAAAAEAGVPILLPEAATRTDQAA
jgi:DeoR family glycerol-3-phosphate regulon repressor